MSWGPVHSSCEDCVVTATTIDIPEIYCPNRKVVILWYDPCMVRYSNEEFFGKMDTNPKEIGVDPHETGETNMNQYMKVVSNMMDQVAVRVVYGNNNKFAAATAKFNRTQKIYGFGQCTPDLNATDCDKCLRIGIRLLPVGFGARVVSPSCTVRFEAGPFLEGPISPNSSPPGDDGEKRLSPKVIGIIVTSAVAILVVLFAMGYLFRKKAKKLPDDTQKEDHFITVESLQYDLKTLEMATTNFSRENELGEGGFGVVYKGTLSNGQEIAVKRLSKGSNQGLREFENEVLLVAKLQHKNLVRVLGFCLAGSEKLLVYEYVTNRSLDFTLFDAEKRGQLNWDARFKIIGGIARGIVYLHHDSNLRIIHRDLKASNILLDADMNPKISDFGTSRIIGIDQSQEDTSRVAGTYGYMAPEYVMRGRFSMKSDVYSFGVLVLEIVSGKKNNSFHQLGIDADLLCYAWKKWSDAKPLEFVDPTIRDSCSSDEVMKCIHLALLCVQDFMDNRPTMATIIMSLVNDHAVTLPEPEQPNYFVKDRAQTSSGNDETGSDQLPWKSIPFSVNEVTLTNVQPRL